MRALIIKRPFIDLILSSEKAWELRGSRTHVRGRIGLIPSGSGTIVATAELVDCIGPLDRETYEENRDKHRSEASFDERRYERIFAWELQNVRTFDQPVLYAHPRGAIVWVRVPDVEENS